MDLGGLDCGWEGQAGSGRASLEDQAGSLPHSPVSTDLPGGQGLNGPLNPSAQIDQWPVGTDNSG